MIRMPFYERVDDVLPPAGAVVPTPEPREPRRRERLVCECCECQQAPDGSVMEYSDKAREMRDRKDTIAKHAATIAAHEQEITRLKSENATLREPAARRAAVKLPGE